MLDIQDVRAGIIFENLVASGLAIGKKFAIFIIAGKATNVRSPTYLNSAKIIYCIALISHRIGSRAYIDMSQLHTKQWVFRSEQPLVQLSNCRCGCTTDSPFFRRELFLCFRAEATVSQIDPSHFLFFTCLCKRLSGIPYGKTRCSLFWSAPGSTPRPQQAANIKGKWCKQCPPGWLASVVARLV